MKSSTACDDQFAPEPVEAARQRFEVTLSRTVVVKSEATVIVTADSSKEAIRIAKARQNSCDWHASTGAESIEVAGFRPLPNLEALAKHYQGVAAEAAAARP